MKKFKLISLQGNEDAATLLEVSDLTTKIVLKEHDIDLSNVDVAATVVEIFLKETIEFANEMVKKSSETTLVNLFDLFSIGFNVGNDETCEKGGNIVPSFSPHIDGEQTEEERALVEKTLHTIAVRTNEVLKKKNNIDMQEESVTLITVRIYLEQLLERLQSDVLAEEKEKLVDMFDLFDLGYEPSDDDDSLIMLFSAKGSFKTFGKSDEQQSNE